MNFPIFNHLKNDNLFQDKTTTKINKQTSLYEKPFTYNYFAD